MVEGGGFEPPKAEPADLQSAPFGHSGTPPEIVNGAFSFNYLTMSTKKDHSSAFICVFCEASEFEQATATEITCTTAIQGINQYSASAADESCSALSQH